MEKQVFHLSEGGEVAFGYSQAVKVGNTVYIAGTMGVDESFNVVAPNDMTGQMRVIYAHLRKTLENFGATFDNMVRETIYVTDMDAFMKANEVRLGIYQGRKGPTATAVEVRRLAFAGQVVEIEATAVLE